MLIPKNKPQENNNQFSRMDWLDRVKGIGILFVVIGHIYVDDGFFSRIIHALNVPLFFIASGYLSASKREWERTGKVLLSKKIHSILFPYFTYSAAVMLWLFIRLFVFHYGSFYEIVHCLADIFCLEGISVLWFLSALFIAQILSLFSLKAVIKANETVAKTNKSAAKINKATAKTIASTPKTSTLIPTPISLNTTIILFLLFAVCSFLLSRFMECLQLNPGSIIHKLILKCSRILGRGLIAATFMLMGIVIRFLEEKCRKFQTLQESQTLQKPYNIFRPLLLLCITLFLSFIGLWHNGLRDFHYLSFGCFPLYFANGFLGFISAAIIGRLLTHDRILTFFGRNSLAIMGTHLIFLDFINIMAVILSTSAGRYLGDEREAKLIVLMLFELLFLYCKRITKIGKKSGHISQN